MPNPEAFVFYSACVSTAILVDAAFFLHKYARLYGKGHDAETTAQTLHRMCLEHLEHEGIPSRELYRIFVYNCPPLTKKAHNPIDGRSVNFSKTPLAAFRLAFHDELRKLRKVALRLGYLDEDYAEWQPRAEVLKKLLRGEMVHADLKPEDVTYYSKQKGVDMRIGLDIASMAFKQQVTQMILISGDSDFVPAAKLARREGIDFVLDPLWTPIREDLNEHVDGLQTVAPKPSKA